MTRGVRLTAPELAIAFSLLLAGVTDVAFSALGVDCPHPVKAMKNKKHSMDLERALCVIVLIVLSLLLSEFFRG